MKSTDFRRSNLRNLGLEEQGLRESRKEGISDREGLREVLKRVGV